MSSSVQSYRLQRNSRKPVIVYFSSPNHNITHLLHQAFSAAPATITFFVLNGSDDSSEDEPLINIRNSLLAKKSATNDDERKRSNVNSHIKRKAGTKVHNLLTITDLSSMFWC